MAVALACVGDAADGEEAMEGVEDAGSDAGDEEGEGDMANDDLFGEGPDAMDIG